MTQTKTLTFKRRFPVAPPRVVKALTDADDRMIWGAPDADMALLIHDQPDPAPGIRDTARVGPTGTPYVTVLTDWIIIDPARVTYAETLEAEGAPFATSLAVFDLSTDGQNTDLLLTVMVASYAGADVIPEVESGWTNAIATLSGHLGA